MKKTFVFVAAVLAAIQSSMPEANEEGKVALDEAQLDALEDALADAKAAAEAKDQEITDLKEQLATAQDEIKNLKDEPAAKNKEVVETGSHAPEAELSPLEQLSATVASAREMMK